jgi:hypothetical protein
MTPSERKKLETHLKQVSEILYNNCYPETLETLEGIEKTVREQVLEHVSPKIALFLSQERQKRQQEEQGKSKVV